jgi:transcriptional regulator with XRE-family HTH domain
MLRRGRGWTQERLASESGVTVRTIQRLEAGRDASLETLRLVATALDVDVHDLFEDLPDNDRREEIMDLDAARADQTRRRDTMYVLYKRATVFGFIIVMTVLGSLLGFNPIEGHPVMIVLSMLWAFMWPLGLTMIRATRSLWLEPYLDR